MDKASLLGDAIAHISHLQEKLTEAETQIKELQSLGVSKREEGPEFLASGSPKVAFQTKPERNGSSPVFDVYSGAKRCKIVVDVLGEEAMIRVNCLRETYSVVNMMMALQDLRLDVQHSNTSSSSDDIMHIIIAKVSCF